MKNMVQEEIRKGPWTEHEDLQLNCFVGLFGDRRWDFIAKVSGLNRTGKSCRLRWVNYLHPGLKRGKMSSQEERLVLELHSKWGNRWSRIAGKIPGRTDNEIKNYWRTHMRKKAQEKKRALCRSSSSLSSSYQSCSSSNVQTGVESFYDTGGHQLISASKGNKIGENQQEEEEEEENGYSMDDIWKEITLPEVNNIEPVLSFYDGDGEVDCSFSNCPVMASPTWEYCSDSIWQLDDEQDSKMFSPTSIGQQFFSCYEYEREPLTG